MVNRKTAERRKEASEAPPEVSQGTKVSEALQPEETQRLSREFWTNSLNTGRELSPDIEKRNSALAVRRIDPYCSNTAEQRSA
jgi:hypothetical protein